MARKKAKKPERDGGRLGEYERKRDFGRTAEPAPGRAAKSRPRRSKGAKASAPRFVVQEHHARRLHWDLRLEHDGVAASWAIPNGVPLDPDEKRLAVHTEDHPLEYLEFEGEIPKGEYGAGSMRIWDHGTFVLEKWEPRKVMVEFSGERLRGRYSLFRTGEAEKDWMIHRISPAERERDPPPQPLAPMTARPGKRLPADADSWAAELRWEGERAFAVALPGRLRLLSAELEDLGERYPGVRRLSRALGSHEAILDGVVARFDGAADTFVLFDLLYLDGTDLTAEPYLRRRELLAGLELEGEAWQTPAHSSGHAAALREAGRERGLGLVLKRPDSPYELGRRFAPAWRELAP